MTIHTYNDGLDFAAGTQDVTPASMNNIVANVNIVVGGSSDADKGEQVTVTSVTGTTFNATFLHPHLSQCPIYDPRTAVQLNAWMWGT